MRGRYRGKVDRTQAGIRAVAEAHGWQVVSLAGTGDGVPDLLVWRYPQGFRLIECKSGPKAKLTPAQVRFRERYTMPVLYLHSAEDAEFVFGAITGGKGDDAGV